MGTDRKYKELRQGGAYNSAMARGSPVDLIKGKLDLVQVVSSYVPGLKKSGRNWWACCPFHGEKTPSFCIWPEDDRWKCFGCGEGGDVFAFIMRIENLDFPGSLKLLAEKAGVDLDDQPRHKDDGGRRKRLLELTSAASLWFHATLLNHPLGERAREFVERRHLTHQTVLDFQLGYAPESWDMLREHLAGKGFSPEEQLAVGVLHESDKGQPYDRFRNRLIFPIRDAAGHVVAFGGRDLGEDKKSAKFINSPQTDLFDKSATLYGLDRAKNGIRAADRAIVVEGYMDAIMAHQHGITNAVCSMGTSLTERQVEQIKRLTTNLVLALDPDAAGDLATDRGIEIGQQVFDRELVPVPGVNGLVRLEARLKADIRVMVLPRGKDPDEVIHGDVAEWQRLVGQAVPLLEYKFRQIMGRHDPREAKGKSAAVAEVAAELRGVPDRIERAHYLQKLATILNIPEAEIQLAMSRAVLPDARRASRVPRPPSHADNDAEDTPPDELDSPRQASEAGGPPNAGRGTRDAGRPVDAEDYLIMCALRYLDAADHWRHNLRTDEITRSENREVLQYLLTHLPGDGSPPAGRDLPPDGSRDLPPGLAEHIDFLHTLASRLPEIPDHDRAYAFADLIRRLRAQNLRQRQLEAASLLPSEAGARAREAELASGSHFPAMHQSQAELGRRTLLSRD
ncbi:MAG: DNA primase [Chloroflexota bacterium]